MPVSANSPGGRVRVREEGGAGRGREGMKGRVGMHEGRIEGEKRK